MRNNFKRIAIASTHAIVPKDAHTNLYRGFTVHRCPRNNATMRTPYRIFKNGDYFGCDFALAEAVRTIDRLHKGVNSHV